MDKYPTIVLLTLEERGHLKKVSTNAGLKPSFSDGVRILINKDINNGMV